MNSHFQKALTEFVPLTYSKEKKLPFLAQMCVTEENTKVIAYRLSPQMLQALLSRKPARLLAVSETESAEQKKIAANGRHIISFRGTLSDIQDRIFDTAIFQPESFLTEDLDPLIGQAQRLVRNGGQLIFLGAPQEHMYASLIKHNLKQSGFANIRLLSDSDCSCLLCTKESF